MLPLDLYARVRISYYHAHETAGAARTRSSLRPLFGEVAKITANLGRDASRECGRTFSVVPAKAGTKYSRDTDDRTEKPRRTGSPRARMTAVRGASPSTSLRGALATKQSI